MHNEFQLCVEPRQSTLLRGIVVDSSPAERSITALFLSENYVYKNRYGVDIWKYGWKYNERPSLQSMIDIISQSNFPGVTKLYNRLTHGDPDSAIWNTIQLDNGGVGYSVSKIINDPVLCDRICFDTLGWLVAVLGIMAKVFSETI